MKREQYLVMHSTKEMLPDVGGYYAIMTYRIYGNVHWSVEEQVWTLEDGTKWDATYPNYWLETRETMDVNEYQAKQDGDGI